MKKLLISAITVASLFAAIPGNAAFEEKGLIKIEMVGIQQSRGQAIFVVMDSESSHNGESPIYSKSIQSIVNQTSSVEIELPVGEYSAVIYHDVNSNGKLDTYFFGKPKEPYGFSNNVRNSFGIPAFAESRFIVGLKKSHINITVE